MLWEGSLKYLVLGIPSSYAAAWGLVYVKQVNTSMAQQKPAADLDVEQPLCAVHSLALISLGCLGTSPRMCFVKPRNLTDPGRNCDL